MSKTICQKLERMAGKFVWSYSGKVLRIANSDLKLPLNRGGLNFPCIQTMSKSLQLNNTFKLLKFGDSRSVGHVWHWIGECLSEFVPDLPAVPNANVPPYFESLAHLVSDARIAEVISPTNWKNASNKLIYQKHVNKFPPSKTEVDFGATLTDTWKNINFLFLGTPEHEVAYLLIHNKLQTRERLFRIRMAQDPYCLHCLEIYGVAVIEDREHAFCSCLRVLHVWNLIKKIMRNLLHVQILPRADLDYLLLKFSGSCRQKLTWLITSYVSKIWDLSQREDTGNVKEEQLFGFLRFKYRLNRYIGVIPDLE